MKAINSCIGIKLKPPTRENLSGAYYLLRSAAAELVDDAEDDREDRNGDGVVLHAFQRGDRVGEQRGEGCGDGTNEQWHFCL